MVSHESFSVLFMHFTAVAYNGECCGNSFQTILQIKFKFLTLEIFVQEELKATCSKLLHISVIASIVTISG